MPRITTAQLRFPSGPLHPAMFRGATGDEFSAALGGYLQAAETELKKRLGEAQYTSATGGALERFNTAEKAYALYLAYTQLAVLAATLPTQASEVNVSASYSNNAGQLRALAKEQLEICNAALTQPPPAEPAQDEYSDSVDMIAEF
jgi:hypothetical protein